MNVSDFVKTSDTPPGFKPWAQPRNQEAELKVAFEAATARGLYMSVQSLEDFNFFANASYPDPGDGNKHVALFAGAPCWSSRSRPPWIGSSA